MDRTTQRLRDTIRALELRKDVPGLRAILAELSAQNGTYGPYGGLLMRMARESIARLPCPPPPPAPPGTRRAKDWKQSELSKWLPMIDEWLDEEELRIGRLGVVAGRIHVRLRANRYRGSVRLVYDYIREFRLNQ